VPGFQYYLGTTIANAVHSGNGRTAAEDSNTDYYLVPLSEDSLRPGTIYADPYGHVLILVKRLPQTGDQAGLFLAVDGQPDGTVARKRFWRGNFLFAQDPALGSPGFKRFRPIARQKNGSLRLLTNDEIANNPDYGDYSAEQAALQVEDFYDRMDDVMSPAPLDPMRALVEAVSALEEQVKARVKSAISYISPITYLLNQALPALREGADAAQRPVPPLIAHITVALSTDEQAVLATKRKRIQRTSPVGPYARMFALAGFAEALNGDEQALDALAQSLVISGDEDALRSRIKELLDSGLDELMLQLLPIADEESERKRLFQLVGSL
jgi:hypothetical protein